MNAVRNEVPSLCIARLHFIACIAIPICYAILSLQRHGDFQSLWNDYDFGNMMSYILVFLLPWLILTTLLLKGIRERRPKFMAPWIFIGCLLIIVAVMYMSYYFYAMFAFFGIKAAIITVLPRAVVLAFMLLSAIPVKKLYEQMSASSSVAIAECDKPLQNPEDSKRYIPYFENC